MRPLQRYAGGRPISTLPRVALATLGCKVNQAETEAIASGFAAAGFDRVGFGETAEVYVINTCTVTHIADRKSRQLVRQARRLNGDALVIATGCYADVAPEAVAALGGVDFVLGNADKERLVELALQASGRPPGGHAGATARHPRTRSLVKVQTGCDNHCTYCIVPRARGPQSSVPLASVLSTVVARAAAGYREIVLTGVHVGAYGRDREAPDDSPRLPGLIRAILDQTDVERLRLSSLEPEDLSPELLALWPAYGERLCRHLHLPLQSGSDRVLRRMGRRYRAQEFATMVANLRRAVPGVAVTLDLMVGFPGESEEEYRESRDFVRMLGPAGMHVFKYSPRPETPAARLPGRVPAQVAKARSEEMLALAEEGAASFRRRFVGESLSVLFEEETSLGGERRWSGLSDNYIRVYATSREPLANQLKNVTMLGEVNDGLKGAVVAA